MAHSDSLAGSPVTPPLSNPPERVCLLGPKSVLTGDLATSEELVILGRLDGAQVQARNLTIGPAAHVRAALHAATIRIEGTVIGDIHGDVAVIIQSAAHVHGDIHAPQVTVREGAVVNGQVNLGAPPATARRQDPGRRAHARAAKSNG